MSRMGKLIPDPLRFDQYPSYPRHPQFKFPFTRHSSHVTRHFPKMLDLAEVRRDQFAACLNQDFAIVLSDGALLLQLSEARPLGTRPESIREPFSLTFVGRAGLRLPQGIYKMRNAQLGEMEIFLVQIAVDQNRSAFEAVFN